MIRRLLFVLLLCSSRLSGQQAFLRDHGAIVRGDTSVRHIALVFTGHEFANGGDTIRQVLKRRRIPASFFFTGDFFRDPRFNQLVADLRIDGHYIGAHSDRHLLYCSWEKRDSLLVSKDEFLSDLAANYSELQRFGIRKKDALVFLPPYEWFNDSIAAWTTEFGLTLVNFTSGSSSNADYTYPELGHAYLTTDSIYTRILRRERTDSHGLNGFIVLMHVGADPRRKDLFTDRLDPLLDEFLKRGYSYVTVETLVGLQPNNR